MTGTRAVWRMVSSGPVEIPAGLKNGARGNSEMVLLAAVAAGAPWSVQKDLEGMVLFLFTSVFTRLKKSNSCNKLFIPSRCIYLCYIFIYWKVYFYS